jgi:hypothetical protein
MGAMKPKIRPDLAVVEIEGEAVIYDEPTRDVLYLNPTASIVFGLCDGTGTVKEMAADIADAFRVPSEQVERQIRSLLKGFKKSGLLEGHPFEHKHRKKEAPKPQKVELERKGEAEHADDHEHDEREQIREEKAASP